MAAQSSVSPDRDKARTPHFNLIYASLDEALAMCGLSPCEQVLMVVARKLSYRTARIDRQTDPYEFRIHREATAAKYGKTPQGLGKAESTLLETGLWLVTSGKWRLINKDYRTWTGRHALSPVQIQTADDAHAIVHIRIFRDDEEGRLGDCRPLIASAASATPYETIVSFRETIVSKNETIVSPDETVVSRGETIVSSPTIEERARVLRRKRKRNTECVREDAHATEHDFRSDAEDPQTRRILDALKRDNPQLYDRLSRVR